MFIFLGLVDGPPPYVTSFADRRYTYISICQMYTYIGTSVIARRVYLASTLPIAAAKLQDPARRAANMRESSELRAKVKDVSNESCCKVSCYTVLGVVRAVVNQSTSHSKGIGSGAVA